MEHDKITYTGPDGNPKTLKSIVIFADVLGFNEEMIKSYEMKTSLKLLIELRNALDDAYKSFRLTEYNKQILSSRWAIKTFTDNIVIGYPITFDGHREMTNILVRLSFMQLKMVCSEFFIRGGIAIGDLYIDDDIVFGSGLIDAYIVENNLARDPRIVLSNSAINDLRLKLEISPNYYNIYNRYLLYDADGQFFLNYLNSIRLDSEEFGIDYDLLTRHKKAVEKKLEIFSAIPHVWNKYSWVANYHNYFCEEYQFDDIYKIDQKKLKVHPTRIKF